MDALAPEILISTIVYTLFGLVVFGGSLWMVSMIAPFSIRKEIEEDQNTALGIMIGAMFVGIALIISAAISG
jgi:uncharacterized membrane protein YjfL (UPF0719 family)